MNWNEFHFKKVFLIASKSKDISSQIGAVLVKDNITISEGYNGFPRGVQDYPERIQDRPIKLIYTVHAEHNAILNCARHGISTLDSILYTTAYPCDQCIKYIIQAGIKKVFIHEGAQSAFYKRQTNWNETHKHAVTMAEEAGVSINIWLGKTNMQTLIGGEQIDV